MKTINIVASLCCLYAIMNQCSSKRKLYINLEHPHVDYYNPKYIGSLVVKSRRYNRTDPIYYLTINITTLEAFDKLIKFHIYFYEMLSNVYKRTFVEVHGGGCDLLENDVIVGAPVFRELYFKLYGMPFKCPLPAGNYSFANIFFSLPLLFNNFPFQEGRVFMNVTRKNERAADVHLDFQLKSYNEEKLIATGTQ